MDAVRDGAGARRGRKKRVGRVPPAVVARVGTAGRPQLTRTPSQPYPPASEHTHDSRDGQPTHMYGGHSREQHHAAAAARIGCRN
jgi:hypothetical protein